MPDIIFSVNYSVRSMVEMEHKNANFSVWTGKTIIILKYIPKEEGTWEYRKLPFIEYIMCPYTVLLFYIYYLI